MMANVWLCIVSVDYCTLPLSTLTKDDSMTVFSCGVNLQYISQVWKERQKHWTYTCTFLRLFSIFIHSLLYFFFLLGNCYILLLILFITDWNTPQKGLLSKFFQPELNNFTTRHPSADVVEPLDNLAVSAGMSQASENETEIAVIHAPSQRNGEESRLLSSNDPSNQDNSIQINTIGTLSTLV